MEIVITNSNNDRLCFNHAVKAVIERNESVEITAFDDKDCEASGAWFLGSCIECFPPEEDEGLE